MKKLIIIIAFLSSQLSFSQAPDTMSYQFTVWSSGYLVMDQLVGFQISIIKGSVLGSAVYVETHQPVTNSVGLASFYIGGGNVISGNYSSIDWSDGPYFIKTEADPLGGTNYTISATNQLLSVPYAYYAEVADSVTNLTVETVVYPSLTTPYTNFGTGFNDVGYYKFGGRVYLQGMADNATSGLSSVIFTLPSGYWPPNKINVPVVTSNGLGTLTIYTNGDVIFTSGGSAGGQVSLEGVSFRVTN